MKISNIASVLIILTSVSLSGCSLLGAAIDHKIDDNSHSQGHHQEGSPFTDLGIMVDIEIFKQLFFGKNADENNAVTNNQSND